MVIPASEVVRWAQPPPSGWEPVIIRPAVPADVGPLEPLHAAEFGEAYATAARLVAAGDPGMVHLTVRESRTAARALYLSLGMRQDAAPRGCRGPRVEPQGMM